jgi:hypothetical protein
MSNNPGKKGRPAPWVERERGDRVFALYAYLKVNDPSNPLGLAETWRRNDETERRATTWRKRKHREWDKANPNPLTEERRRELEAEFAKTYVPTDRS